MLMLLLATVAFAPEWKGSKGMHWSYYMLDGTAGATLWPIYLVGATAFGAMLLEPRTPYAAKRSIVLFFGPAICAVISFWYTFAVLCLNFTPNSTFFAIVPGGTGICYALYCALIWKNREFTLADFKASWLGIPVWITGLLISIGIKIPLAKRIYNWIGPIVARLIVFRWQADLVYLLLKPAEWIIRFGLRMRVR